MAVELGTDALYYPRVVKNLGAGSGGIEYGLLCVTRQNVYYVPEHIVRMDRTGWLSDEYEVTRQRVAEYDGVAIGEVVPEVARKAECGDELDHFLNTMASTVDGSCVIPVSEIRHHKIGYFAQLSFTWREAKYKFSIGGKKNRETARTFFSDQLGMV